jgi:TfoX/Sxy family transcriptional regulator of competence genes
VAYDDDLAGRIRGALAKRRGVTEKKMFGGIGFMVGGNMAVGVHGDEMIVRVSTDDHHQFVKEKGVRIFDITGRPMVGWLLVGPAVLRNATALAAWIARGADYASSLPKKTAAAKRPSAREG